MLISDWYSVNTCARNDNFVNVPTVDKVWWSNLSKTNFLLLAPSFLPFFSLSFSPSFVCTADFMYQEYWQHKKDIFYHGLVTRYPFIEFYFFLAWLFHKTSVGAPFLSLAGPNSAQDSGLSHCRMNPEKKQTLALAKKQPKEVEQTYTHTQTKNVINHLSMRARLADWQFREINPR